MSEAAKPWAPEKCPITQRPLFMWIEHHKTGEMVPTYGGPYDSYTLAEFDGEDFVCERFDHDAGGWLVDCVEGLGVKLVDDQSLVIDPNNTRYDEIEAFAAAPVAAQAQPDPRTPADMLVNGGALKLALNTLRRAGKNEIADELEKTATPAQRPVSGADGLPIELRGMAEAIGNGGGFWRSCSGCHELNEGMATGPFSETLKCHLGVGCSECGGIGAIWDTTDYDAMADFMAAEYQQRTENTEPVGQGQLRDAAQMIEPSGNSGELPSDDWLTGCVGVQNQGGLHQITGLADIRRFAECVLKHWGKQDADRVDAERYRWLRDPKNDVALVLDKRTGYVPEDEQIPGVGGYHAYEYRAGVELDAAIDAARKEQA